MHPDYLHRLQKTAKRNKFLTATIFFLLLFFLFRAPFFWELWQSGHLKLNPLPIWLVSLLLVAIVGWKNGRLSTWCPSWLWGAWLLLNLDIPSIMSILDTTIANAIQLNVILLMFTIFIYNIIHQVDEGNKTRFIFGLMAFGVVLIPLSNIRHWVGSCHRFSTFHEYGCQRSSVIKNHAPIHFNQYATEDELIYPYQNAVWLESTGRIESLLITKPFYVEYVADFALVTDEGKRLQIYHFTQFPIFSKAWGRSFNSIRTLINLDTGEKLDQRQLGFDTYEQLETTLTEAQAKQQEESPVRKITATASSLNAQWEAISFKDNQLQIWAFPNTAPSMTNSLPELSILPTPTDIPTTKPYWTIDPGHGFNCLAFSPDNTMLVAHAGYGSDMLYVYDVVEKQLITAVSIEADTCPRISPDNTLIALARSIEQDSIYLLSPNTGEIITTIPLEEFDDVRYISFSPSGDYLAVTLKLGGTTDYAGLIFNLAETIR